MARAKEVFISMPQSKCHLCDYTLEPWQPLCPECGAVPQPPPPRDYPSPWLMIGPLLPAVGGVCCTLQAVISLRKPQQTPFGSEIVAIIGMVVLVVCLNAAIAVTSFLVNKRTGGTASATTFYVTTFLGFVVILLAATSWV